MLYNQLLDPTFADIATKELGLTLFTPEEIRTSSFRESMEDGDWYLMYRIPTASTATVPALIRYNDMEAFDVGYNNPDTKAAFRIIKIKHVMAKNEHRTFFRAISMYSTPKAWAYAKKGMWRDTGTTQGRLNYKSTVFEHNMTLRHDTKNHGIIGKFKSLDAYFYEAGGVKDTRFYPLHHALTSNKTSKNTYPPYVLRAMAASSFLPKELK